MATNIVSEDMFNSYNNTLNGGNIDTWKGNGVYSFQSGNMAKNVRPFFNKDYSNDTTVAFGKARPLKHYRKGRVMPNYIDTNIGNININEYHEDRSSVLDNMCSRMMWIPGSYSIRENKLNEIGEVSSSAKDCLTCNATTVISNWEPTTSLTDKPQPISITPLLCCNDAFKAKKMVLPPNTNYKRNYFSTNYQYLYNRCQTFKQREFNFIRQDGRLTPEINEQIQNLLQGKTPQEIEYLIANSKPGSPLSYYNLYVAQCNANSDLYIASLTNIIYNLNISMLNSGIITQLEYNTISSVVFNSFTYYKQYIQTTFSPDKSIIMLQYIYSVVNSYPDLNKIITQENNNCGRVYYKPSNPSFANEGGVQSSLRNLQLNKNTIEANNINEMKNQFYLGKKYSGCNDYIKQNSRRCN